MNNKRRHNNYDSDRYQKHGEDHFSLPKYSKGIIFLKSTVFALFIVLSVSLVALVVVKQRKEKNDVALDDCSKIKTISIGQNIDYLKVDNGVITVLTKANSSGEQEVIRFSADCGIELNRLVFKKSKDVQN